MITHARRRINFEGISSTPSINSNLLKRINNSFSTSAVWRTSNGWTEENDNWGTDLINMTASF